MVIADTQKSDESARRAAKTAPTLVFRRHYARYSH